MQAAKIDTQCEKDSDVENNAILIKSCDGLKQRKARTRHSPPHLGERGRATITPESEHPNSQRVIAYGLPCTEHCVQRT